MRRTNLHCFWVGGRVEVSRAVSVVAILIKNNTARDFERPPSHPALCETVCS